MALKSHPKQTTNKARFGQELQMVMGLMGEDRARDLTLPPRAELGSDLISSFRIAFSKDLPRLMI